MSAELRWSQYFLGRGPRFRSFWAQHLEQRERRLLFILGRGFDPRMCAGVRAILAAGGTGVLDCLLVHFDEGQDSPSRRHDELARENQAALEELLRPRGAITDRLVRMRSAEGRRIGSRGAAAVVSDLANLMRYTDVVVDVSAMPRSIYFPLIGKLLYLLDRGNTADSSTALPNLHVVVAEDARLDRSIRDVGIDDTASYIPGFASDLDMEATAEVPKVWIPILGERQATQLERIYHLVTPDEICPVLPSPSLYPRRGDDLLLEYRELLFDRWRVEPQNIIYASEQNPFEAYRQVHRTVRHYHQALQPLRGCKAAISALSSKLLSVGALLAAYELKQLEFSVGIAHAEVQGYEMGGTDDEESGEAMARERELFTLWLAGECYEP